ncbi:MAG: CsbD family protein [Mycobacteriaceae bacterium]
MSAKSDQVKGHVKEAAGVLTGDKDLESEGKTDRRTGEAEEKIDHAKDKVEEVIDSTKDKVEEGADKARDALHRK